MTMIKHQMNSQLGVLKELQNLIDKADAAEATGDVSAEDIDHLRGYVEDMRRACKVAIALEEMLSPKQEKAAAKSEEKSAPKKKSRPKKTRLTSSIKEGAYADQRRTYSAHVRRIHDDPAQLLPRRADVLSC